MCGRYGLFTPPSELESRFNVTVDVSLEPTYNAAPGESLPIIANDAPGTLRTAEWGLIPSWADDPNEHRHINARGETLFERSSFREATERRRCLVLADGFYEWGGPRGERRPHFFRQSNGEPFAMAGLWERFESASTQVELGSFGPDGPDAATDVKPIETFTIVTTKANATVESVHDRMPMVLPRDREREWLTGDQETVTDLLEPVPPDELRVDPVSHAVNDPANDGPELVTPVGESPP
ncbi:MAG: SOS response-associated peptidase [Halorhabdus sp.]